MDSALFCCEARCERSLSSWLLCTASRAGRLVVQGEVLNEVRSANSSGEKGLPRRLLLAGLLPRSSLSLGAAVDVDSVSVSQDG